jgi:hypothetical protein
MTKIDTIFYPDGSLAGGKGVDMAALKLEDCIFGAASRFIATTFYDCEEFDKNEKNIYSIVKGRGRGKSVLINRIAVWSCNIDSETKITSAAKIAVYNINGRYVKTNKTSVYEMLRARYEFETLGSTAKEIKKINKVFRDRKKLIHFKSANAIKINDLRGKIFGSGYDLVLLDDFGFYNKEKRETIIASMKENKHTKFIITSSLPDNDFTEHLSWQ